MDLVAGAHNGAGWLAERAGSRLGFDDGWTPRIENPALGSEHITGLMVRTGSIAPPSQDAGRQRVRTGAQIAAEVFSVLVPAGVARATMTTAWRTRAPDLAVDVAAAGRTAAGRTVQASYGHLADGPSVGPGKAYTAAQKAAIRNADRTANGGVMRSDLDGQALVAPQRSVRGLTQPHNEAHVDHVVPRRPADPGTPPGTNSFGNAQLLSREQNITKSNR